MKIFSLIIILLILPFSSKAEEEKDVYKYLNLFGEAFEKIKNNYVEDVTSKDLIESAIEGMLSSLDPHSTYLNYDELNELKVQTKGEFGGLGIEVTLENGFVKVIAPIDDTPADKAGIKSGDLITHLDDEPVLGMTLSEAVTIMRGKVGSKIKLTINRNENENLQIFITRAIIQLKAVKSKIENNIGYIRVSSFNQKVDKQIIDSINNFKQKSLIGYVLDLRNNPGGLLDQAVNVTDIFLDRGEIVSTRGRNGKQGSRYNAVKRDLTGGLPLVVLINQGSASASEIVAGALQDHKRAIIMGTKSFGKGSVQTIIPSGQDVALKLTTAKYYTPSGRSIQKTGIDPDILVEQVELKKVDQLNRRKESDLRGAIENDQVDDNKGAKNDKSSKKKNDEEEVDDYQLTRAFDLILAINLINKKPTN